MHPSQEKLKDLVDNRLDAETVRSVREHLDRCEFCREFCESYRLLADSLQAAEKEEIPSAALTLADRLYRQALRGHTIALTALTNDEVGADLVLAADGEPDGKDRIRNLTTMYSENPEIVLKVMQDTQTGDNYLQLIADDLELVSNVLVQIPELNHEYLTDLGGRADLEGELPVDCEKLKWQIKMPDALFGLEPLVYDPDKVEYSRETILETERHDRIQVTFEGKTEGKQITLRILELDGQTDFDAVRLSISQLKTHLLTEAGPDEPVLFDIVDSETTINIRVFR